MSGLRCWHDKQAYMEDVYGFGSDKWAEAQENPATCMLPAGHAGPHRWTPDECITVNFKAHKAAEAAAKGGSHV